MTTCRLQHFGGAMKKLDHYHSAHNISRWDNPLTWQHIRHFFCLGRVWMAIVFLTGMKGEAWKPM